MRRVAARSSPLRTSRKASCIGLRRESESLIALLPNDAALAGAVVHQQCCGAPSLHVLARAACRRDFHSASSLDAWRSLYFTTRGSRANVMQSFREQTFGVEEWREG